MISILIPCFDYNAYPLVSVLEKQALMLKIDFEIICIDDGSFSSKNDLNQKINLLTNSKFIESKEFIISSSKISTIFFGRLVKVHIL